MAKKIAESMTGTVTRIELETKLYHDNQYYDYKNIEVTVEGNGYLQTLTYITDKEDISVGNSVQVDVTIL